MIGFNLPFVSHSCIILDTVTFGVSQKETFFSWNVDTNSKPSRIKESLNWVGRR